MFVFITPLLLASVGGTHYADVHLPRHAKCVQMPSTAFSCTLPGWALLGLLFFFEGFGLTGYCLWLQELGQSNMTQVTKKPKHHLTSLALLF